AAANRLFGSRFQRSCFPVSCARHRATGSIAPSANERSLSPVSLALAPQAHQRTSGGGNWRVREEQAGGGAVHGHWSTGVLVAAGIFLRPVADWSLERWGDFLDLDFGPL
ncbi:unnamed protein product, partial [Urochloa humidicola]